MRSISQQDFEEFVELFIEGLSWTKAMHESMSQTDELKTQTNYQKVLADLKTHNTKGEAWLHKITDNSNDSAEN